MSLDRSLKGKSRLERHRNVLRRAERITTLEDGEKWSESKNSVFGLVKVAHRKMAPAKKAPKAVEAVPGAEGAVPGAAAPGTGAAPAAAGKGAAPAAPAAGKAAAAAPAAKPAKK